MIALNYCVPIRRDFVTRNSCYSIALFHLLLLFNVCITFSLFVSFFRLFGRVLFVKNSELIFSMQHFPPLFLFIVSIQLFIFALLFAIFIRLVYFFFFLNFNARIAACDGCMAFYVDIFIIYIDCTGTNLNQILY